MLIKVKKGYIVGISSPGAMVYAASGGDGLRSRGSLRGQAEPEPGKLLRAAIEMDTV